MIENAVSFLESSFLKDALKEKGITDISYNGESFYCASNVFGRRPLAVEAKREEVGSFLRQIANITERQFSYSVPILDVSFGRYRLNAVFPSLARVRNEKSYSFSLRLASEGTVLEKTISSLAERKSCFYKPWRITKASSSEARLPVARRN
jgi:type IV secretory pathway ATPase VirB11/archaellum biosynthesis ATPase